jgi:hypothetical protein
MASRSRRLMGMNSRLWLIGAPVTAFILTVAVSLWQRHADEQTLTGTERALGREIPPSREAAPVPPAEVQPLPAPQAAGAAPPPPRATDPGQAEVPVRLIARGSPDRAGLAAMLLNMSSGDLDVRVTAVNSKTYMRSVVDVSLHANQRLNLKEAGLEIASGDQVTIESPPYRDQVVQAR